MEFHAAVVGPGEAAAAEAAGLHSKVTAVLLHHHVRSDFRGTEETVFALVDREVFANALCIARLSFSARASASMLRAFTGPECRAEEEAQFPIAPQIAPIIALRWARAR